MKWQRVDAQVELTELADELVGSGWKRKVESAWTLEERQAYERWAAARVKSPGRVSVRVRRHDDPEEIGEFVRVRLVIDRAWAPGAER